jgi:hypothetical protein
MEKVTAVHQVWNPQYIILAYNRIIIHINYNNHFKLGISIHLRVDIGVQFGFFLIKLHLKYIFLYVSLGIFMET